MEKTQLATTELGPTGLEITRVGFGAWAIGGGGWEFGWGPQDDDESIAAIHHALELGINWIDTAAATASGTPSRSSAARSQGHGERPYVFTKCSLLDGARRHGRAQPQARLDPARGRGQPRAARSRRDRPLPDPLADPRGGHRGGLVGAGRAQGRGPGPPHRRLQLQRRADAADPADRARRDAAAAVLADRPRRRGGACCRSPSARGSA